MSILLKSANVVGFLALVAIAVFIVLEYLSYFPGSNSQNNSQNTESQNATNTTTTYLTPTEFTFGIWFLIFPLLLGFIICQWFEWANDAVASGVSYFFFCQAVLNVVWLILWGLSFYLIDAIIQVVIFILFFLIYFNISSYYPPQGIFDSLFIAYPFSILAAWNLYILFLYFWIAIPAINIVSLTIVVLAFLSIIGLYIVDYYVRKDNIFAVTIIWILIGIAIHNVETLPVFTTALAGIGLIIGGIFRNWCSFSVEWYASFRFVETGGEYGSSFRNYRSDEPFGPSGHNFPERYDDSIYK
ncbi:23272_t:CDS:2 [Dentiscutata erythropus]|uniref:23272_t:CDS:1 n=1 Tax=Dentiscutata erythropus TaxID=1348616 RepID=A0A9N9FRV6_9GLOM|nr:23272_t:CDS:2 [Dentiscutata erythropus]